jgi:hypothetical protein
MRAFASFVLAAVAFPSIASAHIHVTFPISRTDSLTGDQKTEHCGTAGYNRAQHPDRNNVFAPGSTITVTWLETINHPGHYRIAFQPDGAVFGIPPAAPGKCHKTPTNLIDCPMNVPNCDFPAVNQEGLDASNNSIVLADFIADGILSKEITLPNVECTNCTLQFIQVMTDKCPYTTDTLSDDIYFNCADLTLSATAPDAGVPVVDAATQPGEEAGANPGTGGGGGGCSTGGGSRSALAFAVVLVLIVLRPHSRRRVA